jgi:hypothetical protein
MIASRGWPRDCEPCLFAGPRNKCQHDHQLELSEVGSPRHLFNYPEEMNRLQSIPDEPEESVSRVLFGALEVSYSFLPFRCWQRLTLCASRRQRQNNEALTMLRALCVAT